MGLAVGSAVEHQPVAAVEEVRESEARAKEEEACWAKTVAEEGSTASAVGRPPGRSRCSLFRLHSSIQKDPCKHRQRTAEERLGSRYRSTSSWRQRPSGRSEVLGRCRRLRGLWKTSWCWQPPE